MDKNYSHTDTDELLQKYIAGTSSEQENRQIMQWLQADNENLKSLQKLRSTAKILEHKNVEFNADSALEGFDRKMTKGRQTSIQKIVFWSSSVAAILLLAFGLKFFVFNNQIVLNELASATDSIHTIELNDGSTVTLNKNAKLYARNDFDAEHRQLELEGEGFFEVAHDPEHPFVVYINDVAVKVRGTSFNIFSDSLQNVIVTVKTGKVEVSFLADTVIIVKGQQATFSITDHKLAETNTDVSNSDSWKTGELVFKQTKLKDVLQSLNKNLSTEFVIGSAQLADRELNASFEITDKAEDVEEILSIVLGVTIKHEKGNRVIYAKE